MALFQSGTYNLAAVADQATLPVGCGDAADRAHSRGSASPTALPPRAIRRRAHPDAVRQVLAWMGSTRGNEYLGCQRGGHPRGARRPAGVRQVLAVPRRRRQPVLQGAQRPSHRRSRRRRIRRRDTTRSSRTSTRCSWAARRREHPGRGPAGRELRRTLSASTPLTARLERRVRAPSSQRDAPHDERQHDRKRRTSTIEATCRVARRRRRDLTRAAAGGDGVAHLVGPPQRHGDGRREQVDDLEPPPAIPSTPGDRHLLGPQPACRVENAELVDQHRERPQRQRQRHRPVIDGDPQPSQRAPQFGYGRARFRRRWSSTTPSHRVRAGRSTAR